MAAICSTIKVSRHKFDMDSHEKVFFLIQVFFLVSRGLRMFSIVEFYIRLKNVWLKKILTELSFKYWGQPLPSCKMFSKTKIIS